MTGLLSPLLSTAGPTRGVHSIAAVQNGWSGSRSNRRPIAFRVQRMAYSRPKSDGMSVLMHTVGRPRLPSLLSALPSVVGRRLRVGL
jgi:hypothetical protein